MSSAAVVLALVVAVMYGYIAFAVVPLLARTTGSDRRVIAAARWGAVLFFAGCAVTHVALAAQMAGWWSGTDAAGMAGMPTSAAGDAQTLWQHVVPHAVQIVGGGLFIGIARRRLELTVMPRGDAEQLAENAVQFQEAFLLAPVGVALSSVSGPSAGRLLKVNPALCALLGYASSADLVGRPYLDFVHPADHHASAEARTCLYRGEPWVEFDQRLIHREGHTVWTRVRGALTRDPDGEPRFIVAQLRDITEDRRRQNELQYLADHDPLTDVFNRRRFSEEVDRAVNQTRRHHEPAALLVVDLDQFKYVNDTYGHAVGDRMLAAVAKVLERRLRVTDILGRLGGDEFGVLCPHTSPADAQHLAEDLLKAIRNDVAVPVQDRTVGCAASVGITLVQPDLDLNSEQLLADADLAMYEAKEGGRERVSLMPHGTALTAARSRLAWSERIREALDNNGFQLWEQPILNLSTGRADRSELLLRLCEPQGDVIAPGQFLPAAERFGQIHAIDRWVFRHAVTLLAIRQGNGDDRSLEVNLSGSSMTDERLVDELVDELVDLIASAPIDPSRLIVEITETAAVRNFELARSVARRLTDLGCRFALDDFGSGFGSFYYLKHLPFDGIKIDGEFVKDLPRCRTDRLTLEAITTVAQGLGKELTAEFVQDEETVALLRDLGVDYAQGYHLGRPTPVAELLDRSLVLGASAS